MGPVVVLRVIRGGAQCNSVKKGTMGGERENNNKKRGIMIATVFTSTCFLHLSIK